MKGTMIRRTRTATIGLAMLALAVAACGPQNEAQAIAKETCSVMEAMMEGDMNAVEDLMALDQRVTEANISDEEMFEAIEAECGDLMQGVDGS